MALIIQKLKENYMYISELCDPRTKDFFPSAPILLGIFLTYLYICKDLGPRLMEHRKPYKLKNTILIYNVFQIIASAYIFYEGLMSGWLYEYNWTCQPVDTSESPSAKRMINAVWLYMVIKIVDMLDTVFFVLRKKQRQISFLHVFHHSMMPVASCIGLKFFPNGHGTFLGVINCLVHVIMYTYYLISGLGPQYQKYLWWKKHLTTLQLVQFGIIFIHNLVPLFTECAYPKWIHCLLCIHSLQFIYLFGSFYYDTYVKNKDSKARVNKNGKIKAHTE